MQSFALYLWGRERICPRCGRILRLNIMSQKLLIGFGVIVGEIFLIVARHWLPGPDGAVLVLMLCLPLYAFIVWPTMFALLGNFRLK
jgi:hypothetical protein